MTDGVMALPTALIEIGQYLLLAIGLIILLFLLVLAVALFLTFFMRVFVDVSFKTINGELKNKIKIRFKFLFYKTVLLDSDTFDEEEGGAGDEDGNGGKKNIKRNEYGGNQEEMSGAAEKNRYHLTVTDEKITVRKELCQNSYADYEIILHAGETISESGVETNSKDLFKIDSVGITSIEKPEPSQTKTLDQSEDRSDGFNLSNENDDGSNGDFDDGSNGEFDDDFNGVFDDDLSSDFDDGFDGESGVIFESGGGSGDEIKSDMVGDFSESFDEIKRYVDLSNPKQFASDSVVAFGLISKSAARLTSDLLFRTDIDKMSANIVFGLFDPANTALLFGGVYSFNSSVCVFLSGIESESKSSKKRKKARELNAALRDNISLIPILNREMFEADADFSFSFRISRLFVPIIRFSFRKSTRKVFMNYLYPYFILHSIRTWRNERKQKKTEMKAEKIAEKKAEKK